MSDYTPVACAKCGALGQMLVGLLLVCVDDEECDLRRRRGDE